MLKLFFNQKLSNIESVIGYLLTLYSIKHTSIHLQASIDNHMESPSMLTLQDVLYEYGIESAAVRIGNYTYEDFETPFVSLIQQEGWSLPAITIVIANEGGLVRYLDPISNKIVTVSLSDFEKMDKQIILLLDTEQKNDELNYKQNKSKEKHQAIISRVPIYAFITVLLATFGFMFFSISTFHWILPIFLITSTIGLLISLLLVWHEVDAQNLLIKEVCGGQGLKINCDAVLSSAGSTFFGISWSVWGLAYFASFFLSMLLFFDHITYPYLWTLFSLVALIYLPFSIYYQFKIVQQWCPLCLSVLAVIIVNSMASLYFLSYSTIVFFDWKALLDIASIGLMFLLATYFAIPLLKQARESKSYVKLWKKLHYNPEIFESLLAKSDPVNVSADGLGVVVGNLNAKDEIISVCNPYCGPCAKAHLELEHIINKNKDVKVRVIFTASGESSDIKTAPVTHLLAIQSKGDLKMTTQALDDWYHADTKDYDAFAQKYPMNGELKQHKNQIIAMRDWCDAMKIRATPTIYVNGHELPDSYQIAELKLFF